MFLEKDRVSRVAFENCVCKITDERNQPDNKVDNNIYGHHHAQGRRKATFNLLTVSHDHHGKCCVACVADTKVGPVSLGASEQTGGKLYSQWDDTNYTAPTEADTAEVEQGVV